MSARILSSLCVYGALLSSSALFVGCAGNAKSSQKPARAEGLEAPASAAEYPYLDERKEEITRLDREIRELRGEAGLSLHPSSTDIRRAVPLTVQRIRLCEDYPEPGTDTCTDVCSLKDNICDNAEEICRIADELGGDPWADDKCKSAKGSCQEARDKCCTCVSREGSLGWHDR